MRRGRSACGGLLPAPTKQTQSDEAGGEERESGGERDHWGSRKLHCGFEILVRRCKRRFYDLLITGDRAS